MDDIWTRYRDYLMQQSKAKEVQSKEVTWADTIKRNLGGEYVPGDTLIPGYRKNADGTIPQSPDEMPEWTIGKDKP